MNFIRPKSKTICLELMKTMVDAHLNGEEYIGIPKSFMVYFTTMQSTRTQKRVKSKVSKYDCSEFTS